jgi:hypothetical protein
MARHARAVDPGARLLGIAARYGCGASNHGLGCGDGGSAVGIALLLGVIATVTTVTVLVSGRTRPRALLIGLAGLLALGACALGAHALLGTV